LIEIPINDRDRAIGIGIVIGKYRDDDNPARVLADCQSWHMQKFILKKHKHHFLTFSMRALR
jgi:hypothetical protein